LTAELATQAQLQLFQILDSGPGLACT